MKPTKVQLNTQCQGYNLECSGIVLNSAIVTNLKIEYLDIQNDDELPNFETNEIIEEEIREAIINKAYSPELEF